VFTFGYVQAMRTTMLLPVILLTVGAVSCLALKQQRVAKQDAGHGSLAGAAEARTPDQADRVA